LVSASAEEVVNYYRHGDQTVMVYQDDRVGLLLPFVASFWNLDAVGFANAVIEKSGLKEPPYYWVRFDCATWLAGRESVSWTIGGFVHGLMRLTAGCGTGRRVRQVTSEVPAQTFKRRRNVLFRLSTFHNRLYESTDLARQSHGAWVLARAANIVGDDEVRLPLIE
jgi:hypothetical protein